MKNSLTHTDTHLTFTDRQVLNVCVAVLMVGDQARLQLTATVMVTFCDEK